MKKKMVLVSTLVVIAMSAMFVACSSNTPQNGCKCTMSYKGEKETGKITIAEMKEEGWTTCSQVASAIKKEVTDGISVSCSGY